MMVSGTYWPPYGPTPPRAFLSGAVVIAMPGLQKGSDQAGVFAATRILDAAADVHAVGRERLESHGNVVHSQAARHQTRRADRLQRAPLERSACPAREGICMGVQEVALEIGRAHV